MEEREREKVKSVYYRRKKFGCRYIIVNVDNASEVAIDKVYACYCRDKSVTTISLNVVQDRKSGDHPNLQVGTTTV